MITMSSSKKFSKYLTVGSFDPKRNSRKHRSNVFSKKKNINMVETKNGDIQKLFDGTINVLG